MDRHDPRQSIFYSVTETHPFLRGPPWGLVHPDAVVRELRRN